MTASLVRQKQLITGELDPGSNTLSLDVIRFEVASLMTPDVGLIDGIAFETTVRHGPLGWTDHTVAVSLRCDRELRPFLVGDSASVRRFAQFVIASASNSDVCVFERLPFVTFASEEGEAGPITTTFLAVLSGDHPGEVCVQLRDKSESFISRLTMPLSRDIGVRIMVDVDRIDDRISTLRHGRSSSDTASTAEKFGEDGRDDATEMAP